MPPPQSSSDKATLTLLNPTDRSVIERIPFKFNPDKWTINRSAKWEAGTQSSGVAVPSFRGPNPASVSVEMFLDASDQKDGNIKPTIDKLFKAVLPESSSVDQNQPSAPHARFQWGLIIFQGYIESVNVTYTLFRGTGTPVRGTATVAIKEFPNAVGAQNPTSGGPPGNRVHRMVAGDTLASVAFREYRNTARWRDLAEANDIDDPMRVPIGTVLVVPPV